MKVMTLNIWNYAGRWAERRTAIASLISEHCPDVVALQEVRHDFRFEQGLGQSEQIARITQYIATSQVAQVYVPFLRVDEGVAILSRQHPIGTATCQLTMDPTERDDQNRRVCLGATFQIQGRRVHVFSTHFSLSARARQTNARDALQFVSTVAGDEPAILMGDLNAEPHSPEIEYLTGGPASGDDEHAFVDCWTAAEPTKRGYTYGSGDPVRRIDYVLSRNLSATGISAEIVGDRPIGGVYPSDHMGMIVCFGL